MIFWRDKVQMRCELSYKHPSHSHLMKGFNIYMTKNEGSDILLPTFIPNCPSKPFTRLNLFPLWQLLHFVLVYSPSLVIIYPHTCCSKKCSITFFSSQWNIKKQKSTTQKNTWKGTNAITVRNKQKFKAETLKSYSRHQVHIQKFTPDVDNNDAKYIL